MTSPLPKSSTDSTHFHQIPLHKDSIKAFKHLSQRTKPVFLLDIDNTLYKENNGMDTEIREKIQEFGALFNTLEDAKRLMTEYYFKYGHTLRGYLTENKDPSCCVKTWKNVYDKIQIEKYLAFDPEMYEKLLQFKKNNMLYAFTNGDRDIGMRMLDSLGLTALFEGMIYCDYQDGGSFLCKPDDEVFEIVEEIFGRENLLIFEDRMLNLHVPLKRDWKCYFVTVENDLKKILDELTYLK